MTASAAQGGSPDELLALADAALAKAKRHGDEAEVVLRHDESSGVTVRGELSSGRAASRTLVGVRLRLGRRIGIASAAFTDEAVIERVVERAQRAAAIGAEAAHEVGFATGTRHVSRAFRADAAAAGTQDARERAQMLAQGVRGAAEYFTISTGGSRMRLVVATTGGTLAADAVEGAASTIEARVNERIARAVTGHRMGRAALAIDGFAEELVHDLRLGQRVAPIEAGRATVIFDADTSSKMLPNVAMHLNGALARLGLSRFAGRLGEQVLARGVTIRDAAGGTQGGGRAREVDDEGVRTRARDVVADGVLKAFVYNAEEARLAGADAQAGNGFRGGDVVDAPPRPGFVQMEVAPGARTLAEMVAGEARAVLVKHELLGWYHTTGVSGLVSVVAPCAFLVEHGKVVSGLPPVTLGFDAIAALADARTEIGADAAVTPQGTSAPMLLRDVAVSA